MRQWLKRGRRVTGTIAHRITGISMPFGGMQWADPGPSDVAIVRRFVLSLEDRRVLYNPMDLEVVSQVETSVHAIREECTKTLQALPPDVFAATPLRLIRAAARRFQDDQHEEFRFLDERWRARGATPGFFTALGAFRATVGQQVALLVAYYDIAVEGDLAAVLPELEENGS
jgi:hypothetical protein